MLDVDFHIYYMHDCSAVVNVFYCDVAGRKRRVPGWTLQSMLIYFQVDFICCNDSEGGLMRWASPSVRVFVRPSVRMSPKCLHKKAIFSKKTEQFRAMVFIDDL